ncbi:BTAD domain-containing putative transcriptional regulator [Actinoplanes sp. NPDC089786]|uniref:BTAD domain-containing putative transcriptional regulator n=1 Tax=Actinoplanes sp. NPDC089786 TaxID=3155185 RepID=UPI0034473E9B
MRFGVLGPLLAIDEDGPVDLKGPRHRAVLARLLIARGRVVPATTLIADLWPDPPERAAGAVQTFVGALRKAIEPGRPPRTPPRLLITEGPGYALRLPADAVDAWRFEAAVLAPPDPGAPPGPGALPEPDTTEAALALWRGPAYADVADQPWARAEIDRLDELWLLAQHRRASALLARGRAAEAVPPLEALVKQHPLGEESRRLLALALYRSGRQADALAALRSAREMLADTLGVDPGPALRELEVDILRQAPGLSVAPGSPALIGRSAELAALSSAAATGNRLNLALVSGEPGIGKTALVAAFAHGRRTLWYRNPSELGVPAPSGDPATAQVRWRRAVSEHLAGLARVAPLLVVVEDLHAADPGTTALIEHLVDPPLAAPILLVATYRSTDPPDALLSRLAQASPLRLTLTGLSRPDTRALLRSTPARDLPAATARLIHERSGGNPFYVRELARLADTDADAVPPNVRDVIRHRLAQLPAPTRDVIRFASVLGIDIALDLLPAASLDQVEDAVARGFVAEVGPGRFRFAHALVRDAVYGGLSRTRRAAWHAEVAAAIRRVRPDDVVALAHHLDLAGGAGATEAARVAAERAEVRFEPHEAVRWWRIALRHGDGASVRTRAELIMGLARALAVTGELAEARRQRGAAIGLAAGDAALTTRVICAFDVPANWAANDDPGLAERVASAATAALGSPRSDRDRSRLLATIAMELRNTGGPRAREAALSAVALARGLTDPALLAYGLNALYLQTYHRAGLASERAAIAAELLELADRHGLVTYRVLGHLLLMQARSALGDFASADAHAEAAAALAGEYRIPLVDVFTAGYGKMRAGGAGAMHVEMPGVDTRLDRPATADAMLEARLCFQAREAIARGDRAAMASLAARLAPAAGERAAGSALVDLGPIADVLNALAT